MCVCGAVDGGDSGVGDPAASSTVALQGAGGEQQVDSSFLFISFSSAPSTPVSSTLPSSPLLLPLVAGVDVVFLLRLQLKAQGGVDGDDAAAGGNTGSVTYYLQMISPAEGKEKKKKESPRPDPDWRL